MSRPTRIALALAFAVLAGCGRDASSPFAPEPPEPPFLGPASFACGEWSPRTPQLELAVFDLVVRGNGAPQPEDLEAIRDVGGTVLHTYRLAIVRAELPVDVITRGTYTQAFQVEPDAPYRVCIVLEQVAALSPADREYFAAIGATEVEARTIGEHHYVLAIVDDATIDAIRAREGVLRLGYGGQVGCIGVAPAP